MKKNMIITLLLVSSIMLAACGSIGTDTAPNANSDTQQDDGSAGTEPNSSTQQGDGITPELPLSTQLAIGTLMLEETEFAVASDQASSLLPLWQVLRTLTASDAAAQEEINAIVEQIQETMTSDQLQSIEAMGLTNESIFATMQELGLAQQQVNASGTPQPRGNGEGGFPGGGGGAGGGPGGGVPGGDTQLSPEQIATAQARRAENGGGFGNRLLTPLVGAVIELLESK